MADRNVMRASDADRTQVAERLRLAADEGRIAHHEFDDRLGQALEARTYGELDGLVADLPAPQAVVARPRRFAVVRRHRAALGGAAAGGLAALAIGAGALTTFGHASHAAPGFARVFVIRAGQRTGQRIGYPIYRIPDATSARRRGTVPRTTRPMVLRVSPRHGSTTTTTTSH